MRRRAISNEGASPPSVFVLLSQDADRGRGRQTIPADDPPVVASTGEAVIATRSKTHALSKLKMGKVEPARGERAAGNKWAASFHYWVADRASFSSGRPASAPLQLARKRP